MFADIKLTWNGEERVLRSARILRAIAAVEEVISISELSTYSDPSKIKIAKIADAYGTMLRFAGFDVTGDDVYSEFIASISSKNATFAMSALTELLQLMIPKKVTPAEAEKINAGNAASAQKSRSSKNASKRSVRA